MQCPDCGAYYSEEDEFCGECGLRFSPEASSQPKNAEAEAETSPTEPGDAQDLAGDLVAPALPGPTPVASMPKRGNLLPIVIAGGVALLLVCLGATAAIVLFFIRVEPAAPPPTAIVVQEELAATPLAPVKMPELGALLYEETFDGFGSDWSMFGDEDTNVGLANGAYHIAVYRTNYMAWGIPVSAPDFGDMVLEVDARQSSGPLDNTFGVLVRYLEDDEQYSYYWFQISGDGFYSVDLSWEDEWTSLVGWEPSPAIRTGLRVTNRVRVSCTGGQFSFYVNGVHLVDLVDDTIGRGSIGLAAGAIDEAGVAVEFDDLKVYEPGE